MPYLQKYLLSLCIFFTLTSSLLKADENHLNETRHLLAQKMYEQTLTIDDVFAWIAEMKTSLDELYSSSKVEQELSDKFYAEFIKCYNHYTTRQANYHFNKVDRETNFSWLITEMHSAYVRAFYGLKGFARDEEFETTGLKIGVLPQEIVQNILPHLKETKRFVSEDAYEGRYYVPPGYGTGYEGLINTGLMGYEMGQEQLAALNPLIKELEPALTLCVGSPWRIVNVLCWRTFPEALKWGMNNWHTDGKPTHVRKVMVYLTGASEEIGSTEFILPDGSHKIIEGPPGVWFYGKISEITHRGVPPITGERVVLELRIVPAMELDLRPFSAGFHSFFPLVPWFNPFEN